MRCVQSYRSCTGPSGVDGSIKHCHLHARRAQLSVSAKTACPGVRSIVPQPVAPPGAFVALKPAHSYPRFAPNLLNLVSVAPERLASFLHIVAQTEAQCPAEGLFYLEKCYVYEGKHVLSEAGDWLPSSVTDLGIADQLRATILGVARDGHVLPLEKHADPTVIIAKAGSSNYGHVFAEMLPKLMTLKRLGLPRFRLLLPADMDFVTAVIVDVVRALGLVVDIRMFGPAELVQAAAVYVMSPMSQHDSRKSTTFLELRSLLAHAYGCKYERNRRFLITRGGRDSRKLVGAEQVEAIFGRHGFEPIHPLSLSIPDQIRLFSSASHIAGALGAGLSNIAFAPEGCEVLMMDPGLGDFFFWDFSCLVKQRFTWLFTGRFQGYSEALAASDFAIDEQILDVNLRSVYG